MGGELCRLTLVCAPAAEEPLSDLLLEAEPDTGLTIFSAEGHGLGYENASVAECVRGKIRRCVITMVLAAPAAQALVARLQESGLHDVAYWMEPVLSFGRLG